MNFSDNVPFPKRFKPLPPGYRIIQLDSGHFLWTLDGAEKPTEGLISWDRFWVRRCAFAHHAEATASSAGSTSTPGQGPLPGR